MVKRYKIFLLALIASSSLFPAAPNRLANWGRNLWRSSQGWKAIPQVTDDRLQPTPRSMSGSTRTPETDPAPQPQTPLRPVKDILKETKFRNLNRQNDFLNDIKRTAQEVDTVELPEGFVFDLEDLTKDPELEWDNTGTTPKTPYYGQSEAEGIKNFLKTQGQDHSSFGSSPLFTDKQLSKILEEYDGPLDDQAQFASSYISDEERDALQKAMEREDNTDRSPSISEIFGDSNDDEFVAFEETPPPASSLTFPSPGSLVSPWKTGFNTSFGQLQWPKEFSFIKKTNTEEEENKIEKLPIELAFKPYTESTKPPHTAQTLDLTQGKDGVWRYIPPAVATVKNESPSVIEYTNPGPQSLAPLKKQEQSITTYKPLPSELVEQKPQPSSVVPYSTQSSLAHSLEQPKDMVAYQPPNTSLVTTKQPQTITVHTDAKSLMHLYQSNDKKIADTLAQLLSQNNSNTGEELSLVPYKKAESSLVSYEGPDTQESTPVTLRFDKDFLEKLDRLKNNPKDLAETVRETLEQLAKTTTNNTSSSFDSYAPTKGYVSYSEKPALMPSAPAELEPFITPNTSAIEYKAPDTSVIEYAPKKLTPELEAHKTSVTEPFVVDTREDPFTSINPFIPEPGLPPLEPSEGFKPLQPTTTLIMQLNPETNRWEYIPKTEPASTENTNVLTPYSKAIDLVTTGRDAPVMLPQQQKNNIRIEVDKNSLADFIRRAIRASTNFTQGTTTTQDLANFLVEHMTGKLPENEQNKALPSSTNALAIKGQQAALVTKENNYSQEKKQLKLLLDKILETDGFGHIKNTPNKIAELLKKPIETYISKAANNTAGLLPPQDSRTLLPAQNDNTALALTTRTDQNATKLSFFDVYKRMVKQYPNEAAQAMVALAQALARKGPGQFKQLLKRKPLALPAPPKKGSPVPSIHTTPFAAQKAQPTVATDPKLTTVVPTPVNSAKLLPINNVKLLANPKKGPSGTQQTSWWERLISPLKNIFTQTKASADKKFTEAAIAPKSVPPAGQHTVQSSNQKGRLVINMTQNPKTGFWQAGHQVKEKVNNLKMVTPGKLTQYTEKPINTGKTIVQRLDAIKASKLKNDNLQIDQKNKAKKMRGKELKKMREQTEKEAEIAHIEKIKKRAQDQANELIKRRSEMHLEDNALRNRRAIFERNPITTPDHLGINFKNQNKATDLKQSTRSNSINNTINKLKELFADKPKPTNNKPSGNEVKKAVTKIEKTNQNKATDSKQSTKSNSIRNIINKLKNSIAGKPKPTKTKPSGNKVKNTVTEIKKTNQNKATDLKQNTKKVTSSSISNIINKLKELFADKPKPTNNKPSGKESKKALKKLKVPKAKLITPILTEPGTDPEQEEKGQEEPSSTPKSTSKSIEGTTGKDNTDDTHTGTEEPQQQQDTDNSTQHDWPVMPKTKKSDPQKQEAAPPFEPQDYIPEEPYANDYYPAPNPPSRSSFGTQTGKSQFLGNTFKGFTPDAENWEEQIKKESPAPVVSSLGGKDTKEEENKDNKTRIFIPKDNPVGTPDIHVQRSTAPPQTQLTKVSNSSSHKKAEEEPKGWYSSMWDSLTSFGKKIKDLLRPLFFWVH